MKVVRTQDDLTQLSADQRSFMRRLNHRTRALGGTTEKITAIVHDEIARCAVAFPVDVYPVLKPSTKVLP